MKRSFPNNNIHSPTENPQLLGIDFDNNENRYHSDNRAGSQRQVTPHDEFIKSSKVNSSERAGSETFSAISQSQDQIHED